MGRGGVTYYYYLICDEVKLYSYNLFSYNSSRILKEVLAIGKEVLFRSFTPGDWGVSLWL